MRRRPVRTGDVEAPGAAGRADHRLERILAACSVVAALAAWTAYAHADLVLSHYDAKAHLVVARRVIDSLTPGWKQIGAVWLPLPHLINLLPAQIDVFYRTGAFASAVSVACLASAVWSSMRLVRAMTGSVAGSLVAAALLICNPNVLYLFVTPLTEPLLIALTLAAVLWMYEWTVRAGDTPPAALAAALFAAMWTRYEAWPIIAAAIAASAFARWRRGAPFPAVVRCALRLSIWPAAAVALFLAISRVTVGAWFVTGGFFVPDASYESHLVRDVLAVWWGTHRLSGYVVEVVAMAGAGAIGVRAMRDRRDAPALVSLALLAAAALPVYAFYAGHPFRVRYMIPSVAACAVLAGAAVGWLEQHGARRPDAMSLGRPRAAIAGALIVASLLLESPLPGRGAPLLEESMWDLPDREGRRAVTACLEAAHAPGKVLASMGSLAHYMQELSGHGFALADFIHEGNGAIWQMALRTGPAPHAAWMLVEEASEGGDVLARRMREDPAFTRGMRRVCEGGGVALYEREGHGSG